MPEDRASMALIAVRGTCDLAALAHNVLDIISVLGYAAAVKLTKDRTLCRRRMLVAYGQ